MHEPSVRETNMHRTSVTGPERHRRAIGWGRGQDDIQMKGTA